MPPRFASFYRKNDRPAVKREGVARLRATRARRERRACSIVGADRKMVRYRSCRPPDTELRTQLQRAASARSRQIRERGGARRPPPITNL